MPEVGTIFSKLSKPGQSISSEDMRVLEAFIIKWYSKQVEASTLDDARKAMVFERGIQPDQLPPTSAAIKFHTLRGHGSKYGDDLYNECRHFQVPATSLGNGMTTVPTPQFGLFCSQLPKIKLIKIVVVKLLNVQETVAVKLKACVVQAFVFAEHSVTTNQLQLQLFCLVVNVKIHWDI